MITLSFKRKYQVLNVIQGTGRNYQGLFVAAGTKGRKARERSMWFPMANPVDLINKAAWILGQAMDRGFVPSECPDEPGLFKLAQTPIHPFLVKALAEAKNRPAKSKLVACKVAIDTVCRICEEPIAKRQTAALCMEETPQGLIAYFVCTACNEQE